MAIQYFLVAIMAAAVAFTWRRAKQGALSRTAAILWTVLWALGIAVALRPEVASLLARFFGVGRGADLAIYLSIVFSYYLMFRLYLRIEKTERDMTVLVRKLAMKDADEKNRGNNRNV